MFFSTLLSLRHPFRWDRTNNFAFVLLYGKWCLFLMDEKAKSLRPLNSGFKRATSEKHQVVYNTPPQEWGVRDLNPNTPLSRPEIYLSFLVAI